MTAISCPSPLAAIVLVDVPVLYLCRYLLRRGVPVVTGAGVVRLRFRLVAAVATIYMAMSALFFLRFAPVTPWWGALAAWVTIAILLIVEAVFAFFFFPYSCCNDQPEGDDVENNPHDVDQ